VSAPAPALPHQPRPAADAWDATRADRQNSGPVSASRAPDAWRRRSARSVPDRRGLDRSGKVAEATGFARFEAYETTHPRMGVYGDFDAPIPMVIYGTAARSMRTIGSTPSARVAGNIVRATPTQHRFHDTHSWKQGRHCPKTRARRGGLGVLSVRAAWRFSPLGPRAMRPHRCAPAGRTRALSTVEPGYRGVSPPSWLRRCMPQSRGDLSQPPRRLTGDSGRQRRGQVPRTSSPMVRPGPTRLHCRSAAALVMRSLRPIVPPGLGRCSTERPVGQGR
jgi:hypothetical protein